MNPNVIPVLIGSIEFSKHPDSVLVTYSLGSCIGLTAYDPVTRVGGMAHIMLPDGRVAPGEEGKYATSCVPALIEGMVKHGAARSRIIVKMAGGAKILALLEVSNGTNIGKQNQLAVLQAIEKSGLKIAGSDCGGDFGRTLRLFVNSGVVEVATATRGAWTI
ncbi:MAG: chemotaxis protein CheD [Firmicutes bacterium]|nr:chemotaxis protein CheD [Bacillota bacterium]